MLMVLHWLGTRSGITCLMHHDDTDAFVLVLTHSYTLTLKSATLKREEA